MNAINMPGFSAERSLTALRNRHTARSRLTEVESMNKIIPAVPMPYCKTVCKWRVCGSALPGYPVPMCYSCEQECWIHDSGPYSRSFSM